MAIAQQVGEACYLLQQLFRRAFRLGGGNRRGACHQDSLNEAEEFLSHIRLHRKVEMNSVLERAWAGQRASASANQISLRRMNHGVNGAL